MKIAFKIPPVTNNYSDKNLLVEASNGNISFLIFSKNPFTTEGYYSYILNSNISPAEYIVSVKHIMEQDDVFKQHFSTVNIFYNFTTVTLIPAAHFLIEEKENICEVMFGYDKTAICFQEDVTNQNIKLLYSIPEKIYETFSNFFNKNIFAHSTSAQLNFTGTAGSTLQCIIYDSNIKLFLFKDDKIQLVQYFEYETPADVCYHLLNVCERFQISPAYTHIQLSGMIEKNSGLYSEIYKYFLQVSFAAPVTSVNTGESMQELPHHFYHHLTALALCV